MSKQNSSSYGFEIEPEANFQTDQHQTLSSLVKRGSLSTILRTLGACAVLASLAMFLLDGWSDGNDLYRYVKLLGLTGFITGAGILLSFGLKEVKGARVFFGLGLVATVANFMILGALTYSITPLDNAVGSYSSMLKWHAVNVSTFIPIAGGTFALLSVLARFSFGIFARAEASRLTFAFLALNSLFLIPVRETAYISILSAISLLIATTLSINIVKENTQLLTREAKYALACLFLPGLLMITRALGLYSVDEIMMITIFSLLYYVFRTVGTIGTSNADKPSLTSKLIYWAQYMAGLGFAVSVASLVPYQYDAFCITVFSVALLTLSYDLIKTKIKTKSDKESSTLLSLTSAILAIGNVIAALVSNSSLEIGIYFFTLIAWMSSLQFFLPETPKPRNTKATNLLGITATGVLFLINTLSHFNFGSWVWFGATGMALIIVASIYERYGLTVSSRDNELTT